MLLQFCDPQSGHKAHINVAVKCSKNVKYILVQTPETKKKISTAPLQNDACNPHPQAQRTACLLGTSASLLLLSASNKAWPASELIPGIFQ